MAHHNGAGQPFVCYI